MIYRESGESISSLQGILHNHKGAWQATWARIYFLLGEIDMQRVYMKQAGKTLKICQLFRYFCQYDDKSWIFRSFRWTVVSSPKYLWSRSRWRARFCTCSGCLDKGKTKESFHSIRQPHFRKDFKNYLHFPKIKAFMFSLRKVSYKPVKALP